MTREERNAAIVAALHPQFRSRVLAWLADAEFAHQPLLVQGLRTFEEQAAIYAQGRTRQGPPCTHGGVPRLVGTCGDHPMGARVTHAEAGRSYHNYGLAVDFLDIGAAGDPDKYETADWQATDYAALAALARRHGLTWGGSWRTFKDRPHLEWHPGYGDAEALLLAAERTLPGGMLADRFFPVEV